MASGSTTLSGSLHSSKQGLRRGFAAAVAIVGLAGCNALDRLSQVGEAPQLSAIENPAKLQGDRPVAMPMPAPEVMQRTANSLWRPGSRAFLKDQRANQVGDILTVVIKIADDASISNTTNRSRVNSENANASSLLGYEASLGQVLPEAVDPTNLVDLGSSSSSEGAGSVKRGEDINLRVAALVTQVLPNGNLVIAGQQEVRVNYEVRELQVAGLIRPEDITSINTISYDQIAEARISYGGRGQISEVQQPRYGQQIYDIIWPF